MREGGRDRGREGGERGREGKEGGVVLLQTNPICAPLREGLGAECGRRT